MKLVRLPTDKDDTVTLAPLFDFCDPMQASPFDEDISQCEHGREVRPDVHCPDCLTSGIRH